MMTISRANRGGEYMEGDKFTPRLVRLVFGLWLIYSMILGALYAVSPPSPDQSIFDYIGWRILSGDVLYVDVIEQNWPGAVWLHTFAVWLFGNHLWTFRLFDYGIMLLGTCGLFVLGSSGGLRLTKYIVVPLYQLMYVCLNTWFAGQRDIIGAHFLILLSVLFLWARKPGRMYWMILVGAGFAFVVMIRPSYLLFPALLWSYELVTNRRDSVLLWRILGAAAVAFASFAVTLAAIAAAGAMSGALSGWYEAAVLFNVGAYSGSASSKEVLGILLGTTVSWHWYYVLGAIGTYFWFVHGDMKVLWILIALAIVALVSFLVQGKALGYHLGAWFPVLALLTAQAIAWGFDALRLHVSVKSAGIGAIILLIAFAGSVKKAYSTLQPQSQYLMGWIDRQAYFHMYGINFDGILLADALAVSDYLKINTTPIDSVLVWNRGIIINFLTERRSPLPYATVSMLNQFRTESALSKSWMRRMESTMYCAPPKYIVLGVNWAPLNEMNPLGSGSRPSLLPGDRILMELAHNHYRVEVTIGGAQLWVINRNREPVCTSGESPRVL